MSERGYVKAAGQTKAVLPATGGTPEIIVIPLRAVAIILSTSVAAKWCVQPNTPAGVTAAATALGNTTYFQWPASAPAEIPCSGGGPTASIPAGRGDAIYLLAEGAGAGTYSWAPVYGRE